VLHLLLHVWGPSGLEADPRYSSGQDKGAYWAARAAPSGYAAQATWSAVRITSRFRAARIKLRTGKNEWVCDNTGVGLPVVANPDPASKGQPISWLRNPGCAHRWQVVAGQHAQDVCGLKQRLAGLQMRLCGSARGGNDGLYLEWVM
jgi:hypothetical protein